MAPRPGGSRGRDHRRAFFTIRFLEMYMLRSTRSPLLAVLVVAFLAVLAAPPASGKTLFTLSDPRGDDHGDGNFIYPLNEELDPGDLDLLALSASPAKGGAWFEVTFAKPIRVPQSEVVDDLGPLSSRSPGTASTP